VFEVEQDNGFLTVVFVADEWTGEPTNSEPGKHAQALWIDVNAIPPEFAPTTASALTRYLNGGPQVSLDGWPLTEVGRRSRGRHPQNCLRVQLATTADQPTR
jgi:hypothetical protein